MSLGTVAEAFLLCLSLSATVVTERGSISLAVEVRSREPFSGSYSELIPLKKAAKTSATSSSHRLGYMSWGVHLGLVLTPRRQLTFGRNSLDPHHP